MHDGRGLCAATDPWVLVLDRAGRQREATVLSALTDSGHSVLAGDPPVAVATLRFLIAIVLDATGGPKDEAEWADWWVGGLPITPLRDYLERHADRMHLHGPHPLLQDPETPVRTGLKSVAELVPHLPTGNNAVIYRHTTGLSGPRPAALTPGEALRWLISFHAHARTGLWPSTAGGSTPGVPGPLVDKLLTVPAGPDVGRTVMLSLTADLAPVVRAGLPPWRRGESVSGRAPASVVELLTHTTRHVLLTPGTETITSLLVAVDPRVSPSVPRAVVAAWDPHIAATPTDRHQEGWSLAYYDPSKAAWRSAAALSSATAGARAVRDLAGRAAVIGGDPVRIEVFGLGTESGGKYVAWMRASTDVPGPGHADLVAAVHDAEAIAARGGFALLRTRQELGLIADPAPRDARLAASAEFGRAFWAALAVPGAELAANLGEADETGREKLRDGWRSRVGHLAHQVLDARLDRFRPTPRTVAAASTGHRVIAGAVRGRSAADAPRQRRP